MGLGKLKPIDIKTPEWRARLHSIKDHLAALDNRIEIFVFGSFATGRFTAESDLDIAVILPTEILESNFRARSRAGGPISDWPIDLLVIPRDRYDRKKTIGGVCFDIAVEGIELYPNWRLP